MAGRNEHGQTALHLASIHGHNYILSMLIEAGLRDLINARDSSGKTALHVCFMFTFISFLFTNGEIFNFNCRKSSIIIDTRKLRLFWDLNKILYSVSYIVRM